MVIVVDVTIPPTVGGRRGLSFSRQAARPASVPCFARTAGERPRAGCRQVRISGQVRGRVRVSSSIPRRAHGIESCHMFISLKDGENIFLNLFLIGEKRRKSNVNYSMRF